MLNLTLNNNTCFLCLFLYLIIEIKIFMIKNINLMSFKGLSETLKYPNVFHRPVQAKNLNLNSYMSNKACT